VTELEQLREENRALRLEIERLRAERDESRRLICDLSWEDSKEVARQMGWDCFKEER